MEESVDVIEAMKTRRTIRRFKQGTVPREVLLEMADCARLAPSAANLQPLKYIVIDDPKTVKELYGGVKLGSYLKGSEVIGGDDGERPSAYIAVLFKETGVPWSLRDIGASVQNMLLAAHSRGFAACWIANVKREQVKSLLRIPDDVQLDCMVAVGIPAEKSAPVEMKDSSLYYYEKPLNLRVPKRKLEDIVFFNSFGEKTF